MYNCHMSAEIDPNKDFIRPEAIGSNRTRVDYVPTDNDLVADTTGSQTYTKPYEVEVGYVPTDETPRVYMDAEIEI